MCDLPVCVAHLAQCGFMPRSPPYTCETFGVRWEDVKFTAKEEDSDDEVNFVN